MKGTRPLDHTKSDSDQGVSVMSRVASILKTECENL